MRFRICFPNFILLFYCKTIIKELLYHIFLQKKRKIEKIKAISKNDNKISKKQ